MVAERNGRILYVTPCDVTLTPDGLGIDPAYKVSGTFGRLSLVDAQGRELWATP
jgi:hypothetical protein